MSRSVTQTTGNVLLLVLMILLGFVGGLQLPTNAVPPLQCAEAKRTPVAPGTFVVTLVCRVDVRDEVKSLPPKPSTEESLL